ncbi:hypothetical protein R1flu_003429 [Riccia fluitans]|uniref:Uncharacterized protein n=1 Tax=Riccia fluitans TaxID=41844 RepID=A0ABD1YCQ1_9MARC
MLLYRGYRSDGSDRSTVTLARTEGSKWTLVRESVGALKKSFLLARGVQGNLVQLVQIVVRHSLKDHGIFFGLCKVAPHSSSGPTLPGPCKTSPVHCGCAVNANTSPQPVEETAFLGSGVPPACVE